jgi:hypothetical protein
MIKTPQATTKTAIITFGEATIMHMHEHMGKPKYDGEVTFYAKASGLEFSYTYPFSDAQDIKAAISLGANALKRELDQLSSATQEIQYGP